MQRSRAYLYKNQYDGIIAVLDSQILRCIVDWSSNLVENRIHRVHIVSNNQEDICKFSSYFVRIVFGRTSLQKKTFVNFQRIMNQIYPTLQIRKLFSRFLGHHQQFNCWLFSTFFYGEVTCVSILVKWKKFNRRIKTEFFSANLTTVNKHEKSAFDTSQLNSRKYLILFYSLFARTDWVDRTIYNTNIFIANIDSHPSSYWVVFGTSALSWQNRWNNHWAIV